jgi:hypothetical protein
MVRPFVDGLPPFRGGSCRRFGPDSEFDVFVDVHGKWRSGISPGLIVGFDGVLCFVNRDFANRRHTPNRKGSGRAVRLLQQSLAWSFRGVW